MNEQISIPEPIKQLIAGQLSGSLTVEEMKTLKTWLDESSEHKGHFNEIRYVWALADHKMPSSEQGKSIWKLLERIKPRRHTFWTWQRVAASWAIVFIGSWILYWTTNKTELAETKTVAATATTIHAKMGSQSMVDMPDGSRVWLNGGSKLEYGSSYGEHDREVQLTGEACFDVVTNPEKPFVVKAGNLAIKAFGTTFNVKAYPEDIAIVTTLERGELKVNSRNDNSLDVTLKPSQNVVYYKNSQTLENQEKEADQKTAAINDVESAAVKQTDAPVAMVTDLINTNLYTSWKDPEWLIESKTFGELAASLERRYDIRIVFVSNDLKNYCFSGTIRNETIEQILHVLTIIAPMKYTIHQGMVRLQIDPLRKINYDALSNQ